MTRTKRISAKIVRVLKIMEALRVEDDVTVSDLARRFGVHRTTIYRDLEAMKAAGVKVIFGGGLVGLAPIKETLENAHRIQQQKR